MRRTHARYYYVISAWDKVLGFIEVPHTSENYVKANDNAFIREGKLYKLKMDYLRSIGEEEHSRVIALCEVVQ